MSNLLDLLGLSSSAIKSIQRGSVSLAHGASTNVTINAVDMDKTFITASTVSGYAGTYNSYMNALMIGARLTTTTNVAFLCGDTSNGNNFANAVMYYEVVEMN